MNDESENNIASQQLNLEQENQLQRDRIIENAVCNNEEQYLQAKARADALEIAVEGLNNGNQIYAETQSAVGQAEPIISEHQQQFGTPDQLAVGLVLAGQTAHDAITSFTEARNDRLEQLANQPNSPQLEAQNQVLDEILQQDQQYNWQSADISQANNVPNIQEDWGAHQAEMDQSATQYESESNAVDQSNQYSTEQDISTGHSDISHSANSGQGHD